MWALVSGARVVAELQVVCLLAPSTDNQPLMPAGYQHSLALAQKLDGRPAMLTGMPPQLAKSAAPAAAKQQQQQQQQQVKEPVKQQVAQQVKEEAVKPAAKPQGAAGTRAYVAPEQWDSDPVTKYLTQVGGRRLLTC